MIAYIVNQYPSVSHSFVRREIRSLEKNGMIVRRFAMRGWDAELVDPEDIAEREITTYLLLGGAGPMILALIKLAFGSPARFLRAASQSIRMVPRSDRSVLLHIITLFEACLLAQKMQADGVTHVHAHFGTNSTEVAMLASLLSGIPYSFTVHGPDEFDKPEFIKMRDKVHHAKFVSAISAFCTSQLFRWIDFADWRKIKVVRCGIANSYHSASAAAPDFPNRLVCVGRLSAQKGHKLLIQAAARVVERGHDFELVLVGDGEMRPEIEALIREHNLTETVRITGWASGDTVRQEILAARGLILTSFAEGLPVVIMEAMALGRIVLATQIAAIPELVRNGETGWLFPAGSVEAAADAIDQCLSMSASECEEMGRRARTLVGQRHDVDREAAYLGRLFASDPIQLPERLEA